jgi:hypothetical protein
MLRLEAGCEQAGLMGLISDFFLATPAEIESVDLTYGPIRSLETLEWKGVDPIKLSHIEEWLTGTDPGEIEEQIVRQEEEFLVVKLNSRLTTALATLSAEAARQFAKEWLLSDDDDELLQRLIVFARIGQANSKEVYVWMSP